MKAISRELYEQIVNEDVHEFIVDGEVYKKQTCILSVHGDVNWDGQATELLCTQENGTLLMFVRVVKQLYDYDKGYNYYFECSFCGEVYNNRLQ